MFRKNYYQITLRSNWIKFTVSIMDCCNIFCSNNLKHYFGMNYLIALRMVFNKETINVKNCLINSMIELRIAGI